jgi:hypothetical protein
MLKARAKISHHWYKVDLGCQLCLYGTAHHQFRHYFGGKAWPLSFFSSVVVSFLLPVITKISSVNGYRNPTSPNTY